LEAVNWEPDRENWYNWGIDMSLFSEEIAARTGTAAEIVTRAEEKRHEDIPAALAIYKDLANGTNADARTREFARLRTASLEQEVRLANGEWIDLQPKSDDDPNWVFVLGKGRELPDGTLEVEAGPNGHLLYSRVRVGSFFEVKGEFEVVHTSSHDYQAGIVFGLPEPRGYAWNSFRIKRNETEGRVVNLGHGWRRSGVTKQAPVQDDTNSFTFKLVNYQGSASVNGKEVMQSASQPSLGNAEDEYLLGLGAYNDENDTVIRYRNVKVRRVGVAMKNAEAK
jgi:hypothetical protein